MEPSEFLDLLGNENRRKILALLADRPYFVSEISARLNVAPKAVIGHLSLLEKSGLIESSVDDQRRKYYSISKSMILEVSVSPYSYSVHVNNIQLEISDEPVYSLSVSFNSPDKKTNRRKKKRKDRTMPTGPVIHLASSYADSNSADFRLELIGPLHPYFKPLALLTGIDSENQKNSGYLIDNSQKSGESFFDSENLRYYNEELNAVYDAGSDSKTTTEPELILPKSDGRLKSRDGYFLSQIFQVREELDDLFEKQEQLIQWQKELSVRQNNLMQSFIHYAKQLSEDKVDLDILFRLLKSDMNTAELCHETGYAPAIVLQRLKKFENKKMVEKSFRGDDFIWRLKYDPDI